MIDPSVLFLSGLIDTGICAARMLDTKNAPKSRISQIVCYLVLYAHSVRATVCEQSHRIETIKTIFIVLLLPSKLSGRTLSVNLIWLSVALYGDHLNEFRYLYVYSRPCVPCIKFCPRSVSTKNRKHEIYIEKLITNSM